MYISFWTKSLKKVSFFTPSIRLAYRRIFADIGLLRFTIHFGRQILKNFTNFAFERLSIPLLFLCVRVVWEQHEQFLKLVRNNRIVVLVGETGARARCCWRQHNSLWLRSRSGIIQSFSKAFVLLSISSQSLFHMHAQRRFLAPASVFRCLCLVL